jgi:hypothetical protein
MLKKEGFMVDYYTDAGNALFHFRPDLGVKLYDKLRAIDKSIIAVLRSL